MFLILATEKKQTKDLNSKQVVSMNGEIRCSVEYIDNSNEYLRSVCA